MTEQEDTEAAVPLARELPAAYAELRALAGRYLRKLTPGHSMQPTAIVHDAYVRLAGNPDLQCRSQSHFFALSAKAMRHILADHARQRGASKRAADRQQVTLSGLAGDDTATPIDVLDLDAALTKLEAIDERQARVVEYRFFAGLTVEEVAEVMGVSERTVHSDWRVAKARLRAALAGAADDE